MNPALAIAYWWDSLDQRHNFSDCNLKIATRPDDDVASVMTIHDNEPYRWGSVELPSVRHASCIVSVREDNYATGWEAIQTFCNLAETVTSYVQNVDEGYRFEIGHMTIRMGPIYGGHIPQENLELFTATVSFTFGYVAN